MASTRIPCKSPADRAAGQAFFRAWPAAKATFDAIRAFMATCGPMEMAATKSRDAPVAVPAKAWTCPRCGQTYARRNQSHSCDRRAVEELFAEFPKALKVTQLVQAHLDEVGGTAVRTAATKTQVSFAAQRRFAWVWVPQQATGSGPDDAFVSFLLPRRVESSRVRDAVNARGDLWTHHVPVKSGKHVDDELKGWLAEAYETVGAAS